MAAPLRPAATKAYLREKWIFVPAISGAAGPTVAEATGASALDVTNMIFASAARPSQSTNVARTTRRLGDANTYEFIGESQLTLGELRYAFNPQGAALSDGKKAFEKFPEGTTGFLVCRLGIDRDTNEVLLLAVDGRSDDSRGYTMVELARMMQDLGADEALNLDGGGSTTMVGGKRGVLKVLNDPSDSVLRNVANALVVRRD